MVLGALRCINKAEFAEKLIHDNIVLGEYLSQITTRTGN